MRLPVCRAVAVLIACAACRSAPAPSPAPRPQPAPAPAAAPRLIVDEFRDELPACVVRGNEVTTVGISYAPATGDTTIAGRPFAEAFPVTDAFAQNAEWYVNNVPIVFQGHHYVKYGLPRELAPGDVSHVGDYGGVPVFAEQGAPSPYDVLYVPVRPSCEFQPYSAGGVK